MKLRPALFRSAAILLFVLSATSPGHAASLDEAIAKSRQTGAPMLVLVTSPYCAPCKKLKRRLETEEELQGLIHQYVGIHFDLSDPALRQWTEKYKPRTAMVPMIFVVSSSGRMIYNDSGAPQGEKLAKLLKYGLLQNANYAKDADAAEKVEPRWRAVDKAARSVEAKKYDEAVETLKPHLSKNGERPAAGKVTYRDPVAPLRARLRQLGQSHLEQAKAKLAREDKQLFGLLALAQTRRWFGDLPELQEEIEDLHRRVREDADKAEWIEQVETIDRGRAAEQAGDYDAALDRYREVIAKYPDAQAARLCAIRVQQITGEPITARPDADRIASQTR